MENELRIKFWQTIIFLEDWGFLFDSSCLSILVKEIVNMTVVIKSTPYTSQVLISADYIKRRF